VPSGVALTDEPILVADKTGIPIAVGIPMAADGTTAADGPDRWAGLAMAIVPPDRGWERTIAAAGGCAVSVKHINRLIGSWISIINKFV